MTIGKPGVAGNGHDELNGPSGRPSGVYIRNDILYVADSQSSDKVNAPFRQGIRIGSVKDGKVTAFIAATDPKAEMPEGVTVDKDGHVFGGFTANTDVKEYVKIKRVRHAYEAKWGQVAAA